MATKEKIEALYKKYLDNDISEEELEQFLQMLHVPEDEKEIGKLMDGTWQEMFEKKPVIVPMYKRRWYKFAVAAAILLFVATGAYFIFNKPEKQIAKTEFK